MSMRHTDECQHIAIENAITGICIVDTSGNVVEINQAFCDMLGYTRAELMHRNICDWEARYACHGLRRDGTYVDADIDGCLATYRGRPVIVGVLTVLQHHERLDGSGYPRGLQGEAILLEARIIAVADTLEAMASHRPYRPALGLARALEEIHAGRGSRYDPQVVDACLVLFQEKHYRLPE